jgi:hypothetical protein
MMTAGCNCSPLGKVQGCSSQTHLKNSEQSPPEVARHQSLKDNGAHMNIIIIIKKKKDGGVLRGVQGGEL